MASIPTSNRSPHAVRASMSIPFLFHPVSLTSATGLTSTLVDGGLLSNFPIDSLDRTDGREPRWPTFGVTVMPNVPKASNRLTSALGLLRLGAQALLQDVVTTMLMGHGEAYLNQPWVSARAVRVGSADVGVLRFGISNKEIEAFYTKGNEAARDFLATWDWQAHLSNFRKLS
jgi:NTE family protein